MAEQGSRPRDLWPQIRDAMAANMQTLAGCDAPLRAVTMAYGCHVPVLTIGRQDETNTLVRKVPVESRHRVEDRARRFTNREDKQRVAHSMQTAWRQGHHGHRR